MRQRRRCAAQPQHTELGGELTGASDVLAELHIREIREVHVVAEDAAAVALDAVPGHVGVEDLQSVRRIL